MKNKKTSLNNTVSLDENISINTNNFKKSNTIAVRIITLLFCVYSVLLTLKLTINMPIDLTVTFFTVLFVTLFTFINNLKKHRTLTLIGLLCLFFILCYLFRSYLLYGVQIICTNFMEAINQYYFTNYEIYFVSIPYMSDYYISKTVIMTAISFLISFYFSIALKNKKSIFSLLIVFSSLFWMDVNFADKPQILPILLMLLTFIAVYSIEGQPYIMLKQKPNREFINKLHKKYTSHFYSYGKLKSSVINRNFISSLALSLSIIAMILLLFPQGSYKQTNLVRTITQDQLGFIQNIWDKLSNSEIFSKLSIDKIYESGVGSGNLNAVDRDGFSQNTHLKIIMEKEEPMLLKGYVGSVYEGNRWTDFDKTIYDENEDVLSQYSKKFDSYINKQGSLYINDNVSYTIIKNIRANKNYVYLPYGYKLAYLPPKTYGFNVYDEAKLFGDREYKVEYYPQLVDYFNNNIISFSRGINKKEIDLYTDFVYKNYLDLPEDKLNKIKNDFNPIKNNIHPNSINAEIEKVENYLNSHAVYDLSPGKLPSNKDYIEYFLYENHRGYCSHFATAATMMFRAMGIPARYVEGYTVTQQDIENNKDTEGIISIKDSNAHAWTEVYLPAYGWMPVDVTPGFSDTSIVEPKSNVTVPKEISDLDDVSSEVSSQISSEVSSEVPSVPQTSSNIVSEIESKPNSEETNTKNETGKTVFWFFLSAFLIVIASFLILLLRYYIVSSKRQASFKQKEVNNSVMSVYDYLEKILSFIGYTKNSGETQIEFAKRVTNECTFIDDESFIEASQLVLKAKFSAHTVNRTQLNQIRILADTLNNRIYKSLKLNAKFKYWFIDNLK